jgi:hypothetical protein
MLRYHPYTGFVLKENERDEISSHFNKIRGIIPP